MHAATVGLVLLAAALHAIWNTASKYKRGDTVLFVWAYSLASVVLCVPIAAVLIAAHPESATRSLLLGAAVSAVLHVLYALVLQTGYDRAELGTVYPVARGTGPVLTMAVAIALLGERPGPVAVVGAVVVVAGIVVVAGNPLRGGDDARVGVLWGAATGATIAAYTLWDDFSVTSLDLDPMVYFTASLVIQTLLLTPSALRRRSRLGETVRRNPIPIAVVAVGSPLAYVLVLTAMRSAPVALVAPLRESSIVVGSLLAWRLFGEGPRGRKIAGALIVLAGIVAISV